MANKNRFHLSYELQESGKKDEAEILIYSDIVSYKWFKEDVTASDFDKLLKEAKNSGATKLRLRINSPGGNVWQAVAIKTMVETSGFEEVNIDIEGLCASAATFFTCIPGAKVRIADGSEFMIHNPSAGTYGTAMDMRKTVERLEKMQTNQHGWYATRTGQSEEQIKQWMDEETWFTAKETVEAGFADELIKIDAPAACASREAVELMEELYQHIPEGIRNGGPEEPRNQVRNEGAVPSAEHTQSNKEGTETMEIKDLTAQQLREGNPELFNSLVNQGVTAERARMQEIDELTDKGYEALAQKAKNEGTSAAEFLKQVVKERKERGDRHLQKRQQELASAGNVTGGASGDNDGLTEEQELAQFAKDMAALYGDVHSETGGSMY